MHEVKLKALVISSLLASCFISFFTLFAVWDHETSTAGHNWMYALLLLIGGFVTYKGCMAKLSPWILTLTTGLLPVWLLYRWGVDFPHGLLLVVFAGVVAVTLVPRRYAAVWLAFLLLAVVAIGVVQDVAPPADSWKSYQVTAADGGVFAALILITFLVLARFHRQLQTAVLQQEEHVDLLRRERELLLARDLERARALSQLHEARIEDLAAFALIGKQSAKLFHDLGGPLSALAMYLDSEKPGPARSATEAKLAAAKASAESIEGYVRDVTRMVQGESSRSNVELVPLAQRAIATLAPLALERGVKCKTSGKGTVQGQPLGVSRALQNLVQNAIEAADSLVEVRLQANGWQVIDDGAGLTTVRTRKPGPGHGLGLIIVREILGEHGASLVVSSGPEGRGTLVEVRFP